MHEAGWDVCTVPLIFPFFLLGYEWFQTPRGHDASIRWVQTLFFAGDVWRSGPHGSHEAPAHWSRLRAHPFPDDTVNKSVCMGGRANSRHSSLG